MRQIVHHIADSHLNAFVRFKLALTEDRPTIKPFDEGRWVGMLRAMTADQFDRMYFHPEARAEVRRHRLGPTD